MDPFCAMVVSVIPFQLNEWKPGVYPNTFVVPAAEDGDFSTLLIGKTNTMIPILEGRALMVDTNPYSVAEAVVNDYLDAQLARNPGFAEPGIFAFAGGWVKEELKKNAEFQQKLQEARTRQTEWFLSLVKLADDSWARTQQHKTISDIQRHAAKSLKMQRPWVIEVRTGNAFRTCPACQEQISALALKCPVCQTIVNQAGYDALTKGLKNDGGKQAADGGKQAANV